MIALLRHMQDELSSGAGPVETFIIGVLASPYIILGYRKIKLKKKKKKERKKEITPGVEKSYESAIGAPAGRGT
jgi:hypothetical protein